MFLDISKLTQTPQFLDEDDKENSKMSIDAAYTGTSLYLIYCFVCCTFTLNDITVHQCSLLHFCYSIIIIFVNNN